MGVGILGQGEPFERLLSDACASAAFEDLLLEIDRLEPGFGGAFSAPKRIAALALYVQATTGVDEDTALHTAMSALAPSLSTTQGGLKKASSEARAILQFGLDPDRPVLAANHAREHLPRAIAGVLRHVSVREVTRARAAALRGIRGGRRHVPRQGPGLAAIRHLLALAYDGDPGALAELAEIRTLLGEAPTLESSADRPEATQ